MQTSLDYDTGKKRKLKTGADSNFNNSESAETSQDLVLTNKAGGGSFFKIRFFEDRM